MSMKDAEVPETAQAIPPNLVSRPACFGVNLKHPQRSPNNMAASTGGDRSLRARATAGGGAAAEDELAPPSTGGVRSA